MSSSSISRCCSTMYGTANGGTGWMLSTMAGISIGIGIEIAPSGASMVLGEQKDVVSMWRRM